MTRSWRHPTIDSEAAHADQRRVKQGLLDQIVETSPQFLQDDIAAALPGGAEFPTPKQPGILWNVFRQLVNVAFLALP